MILVVVGSTQTPAFIYWQRNSENRNLKPNSSPFTGRNITVVCVWSCPCQNNSVHTLSAYLFKILPATLKSPNWHIPKKSHPVLLSYANNWNRQHKNVHDVNHILSFITWLHISIHSESSSGRQWMILQLGFSFLLAWGIETCSHAIQPRILFSIMKVVVLTWLCRDLYHLVTYMQSNKIHKVFQRVSFFQHLC